MSLKMVEITADKIKNRERRIKLTKRMILIIFLILLFMFLVLSLVYKGGRFTIILDPNFSVESGIVIYADPEDQRDYRKLSAKGIDFMDNISVKWLPSDIADHKGGAHNGKNYIAYTFYIDNKGNETLNYWYEVYIDDIIKNVDEALRIMIIHNGEKTIYAKANREGKPEENTVPFYSNEIAILKSREDFKPGEVDKMTIVIWLEGDDPDCVDSIIGGEAKMHMEINEEHLKQEN